MYTLSSNTAGEWRSSQVEAGLKISQIGIYTHGARERHKGRRISVIYDEPNITKSSREISYQAWIVIAANGPVRNADACGIVFFSNKQYQHLTPSEISAIH